MKRLILPLLIFLFSTNLSFAQSEAKHYISVADSIFENADYATAETLYQKASVIYAQSDLYKEQTHAQNKQAECLAKLGRFDLASDLANKSLELGKKELGAESLPVADAYNTIGLIQLNKGRDDLALKNLEQARKIYHKLYPNEADERIAQVYSNIGLVYWDLDNHDLATEFQLKALGIRQKLFSADHVKIGASYNDLGLIESGKNIKKAESYYQKALAIYQKAYGEAHPKVGNTYVNLASIYLEEENYEQALQGYFNALDIWNKVYGDSHPNEGFVYNLIGQTYATQENWDLAIEYQEKALVIYQKNYGIKHPKIANTFNLLGNIYFSQQYFSDALAYAQKALIANHSGFTSENVYENPQSEEFLNPTSLLASLQLKARALEGLHYKKSLKFKDLEMALSTLEQADKYISKIRQTRNSKKDKISLGETASEIYEDAIRLCFAMSEVTLKRKFFWQKAFSFSEKSKGAVLLSAVTDTEAKQFGKIPTKLLEQEKELQAEITTYEQRRAEASTPTLQAEYREKLFSLNQQYTAFIKSLEEQFPDYYDLKFNVKTADIETVQASLDTETAFISYFLSENDKRVYGFILTNKKFDAFNVPMHNKFTNYQIGMQNSIIYKAREVYLLTATELYKQLFPIKIPNGVKNLVIVPTGNLSVIPFEALLTKEVKEINMPASDLPYLINDYAISYHVSATLFTQQKEVETNPSKGISLFCPVSFEGDDERDGLSELPATETEVKSIATQFEAKNLPVQVFSRANAQESALKSGSAKARILHLATHGMVNQEHPGLSRIFFSSPTDEEDGNLNAAEIYDLADVADYNLVVMSACQTGLGKISKGEGTIGLSRAWMFAGVENQVVSFWTVADKSTAKLMDDFYSQYLAENSPKGYTQAVRQAKLQMIKQGDFAEPYFWSAFVLIGR